MFVPFDAFWLALAALLVASAGSLARLRSRHASLWQELGSPRFLPTRSSGLASSTALTRFYWSRRVADLGDPSLTRWVTALRCGQIALAAVLVALASQSPPL
jgi:hypothetical protein